MRKRAPLLFPTSLLVAASLESAHAWTVQNDRDVPCTVSHLAAYGSSGFQGSIMRLAPVPVAYHLCPLQALDAMALLSHTRCFDTASLSSYSQLLLSYYLFLFLFHLISFSFFFYQGCSLAVVGHPPWSRGIVLGIVHVKTQ